MSGSALVVAKVGAKISIPIVKRFVTKLAQAGDEAWQRQRDKDFRDWQIESAQLAEERFHYLVARIDGVEAKVDERIADPATQRVHANLAQAADQEPMDERRRMLAYADAALIDTTLTIAQHSRVERLLRELDPDDVLWLNVIARSVHTFFEGKQTGREGRVRWLTWDKAGADVLAATGCVRISHQPAGTASTDGQLQRGWDEAEVTREGRLVLRVLRLYLRARQPPMPIPGREPRSDDRSEQDAWRMIDAVVGLRASVIRLSTGRNSRYDFPKPNFRDGKAPPHDAKAILSIADVPIETAEPLSSQAPFVAQGAANLGMPVSAIEVESRRSADGTWSLHVHGPHDVLRHLADEIDAPWL